MKKHKLLITGLIAVVILTLTGGCSPQPEEEEESSFKYTLQELESYMVVADSSVQIVHWFDISHQRPGLFHEFYDGDLYIMATYDGDNFVDLEIKEVFIDENSITITAQGGKSVLRDGTTNEVDSYYSNVYVIKNVETASGGSLSSNPYKLVLER